MMIRAPSGSGKTQQSYDLVRFCLEKGDITCIYAEAKNPLEFEKLVIAMERYHNNPNNPKHKLVVIVDEIQSRYAKKVKTFPNLDHLFLIFVHRLEMRNIVFLDLQKN